MKIEAWKSSDGKLFEHKKDFVEYSSKKDIEQIVHSTAFLNVGLVVKAMDDECGRAFNAIDIKDIGNFIFDNLDSVVNMVNNIQAAKKKYDLLGA